MTGYVDDGNVYDGHGLCPVINLKSILKFTGDGPKTNPYALEKIMENIKKYLVRQDTHI